MKKKYIIIILILILIIFAILAIFLWNDFKANNTSAKLIDENIVKDFIIKNEVKEDKNCKTFFTIQNIDLINNKENMEERYELILFETYNDENELLEYKQSDLRLYKFIVKDDKIIDSNYLNTEDIRSIYTCRDYSVFPEDVIEKCITVMSYIDHTKSMEKYIDKINGKNDNTVDPNALNEVSELNHSVYDLP